MLYLEDRVAKLGNVYIGGEVTSIEVEESANIYTEQDEQGRVRATQPSGYEQGKVMIDIILEDTPLSTALEQMEDIQQLFKSQNQEDPEILQIVNEDCAARGISQVYFKSLNTKKVISESKRIASMELLVPTFAGITVNRADDSSHAQIKKSGNITGYSIKTDAGSPSWDAGADAGGLKIAKSITRR